MKNKILTLAALSLMAAACAQKTDEPLQYGELSVSLSGEPAVDVVTKAPESLTPADEDASAYMVRIYDSADAMKYESAYLSFEAQRLPLGTYYVTAENCTEADAEAGNGKMRLYGRSLDMTLTADALSQTATVNCTVANALVSVLFDESVKGRFSGLQVTLSGGTERTSPVIVAETDTDEVTETWFNPSTVTYTISGTFTGSGMNKAVEITNSITLEAKNNILLRVRLNLENGQLMPALIIDTQIDDLTEIPEEFNPYE